MPIGVFRQTDGAGLGDTLQSRGDINAVAHQVAVTFLDDVPDMNAYAELDALLRRKASVALDHAVLYLNGTTHSIDRATELDNRAIACPLDNAPVVHGDDGINQIASQRA